MVKKLRVRSVVAVFALLWALTLPAWAQISTGTVAGTVKDVQGGVIPGATVTLISEARGTRSSPAVTTDSGDFVFVNMVADTYTVEVTLQSFKTLKRSGIAVSPGARIAMGTLTLEIGGAAETVEVRSEAPQIQANSGERSFSVTTESVTNLPVATRNFADLINLTPGVVNGNRAGDSASTGGGANNFMMDGVSTMEPGSNRLMIGVNVESIAEVKVLTSSYQAEYGRSSGLQITAVTKSGSNQFRGSAYDIQTNSDWDSTSWVNEKNGDPKVKTSTKTMGYTIGGPIGKPGGTNRLFVFYSHEYRPVTAAINQGNPIRIRVPTALERAGDFSQTRDNTGALFNLIRDPNSSSPCTAANTAGCFQAGGVLGRIPADRLYPAGLAVLNRYPLPNATQLPGGNFNYDHIVSRTDDICRKSVK